MFHLGQIVIPDHDEMGWKKREREELKLREEKKKKKVDTLSANMEWSKLKVGLERSGRHDQSGVHE